MEFTKLLVTIGGIGLIGFIYWFFFGKKTSPVQINPTSEGHGNVDILVDGGYQPSVIKVKKGVETTLSILRRDTNTCLEEIVLPDFKIRQYLPVNEKVEIKFTPDKSGEFGFHCGMNMFHGKIIVT